MKYILNIYGSLEYRLLQTKNFQFVSNIFKFKVAKFYNSKKLTLQMFHFDHAIDLKNLRIKKCKPFFPV